ncbi:general odorant-binding protein 72-like [Anopheles ziemanni]|uniref:general odorant-binding protein 72-like n=1 Tax=Anopheles coustani TaxID=139045 RepID=UPI00265A4E01|nr:general odorant-binding protein 72-like [Anopheles coustani]XP_058169669.1 general odorant-binding protein 72-like [Anopheles ziemanni]
MDLSVKFRITYLLIIVLLVEDGRSQSTVDQMAKTSAMMRLVCIGKHKASEQLVDGLGRGEFADSKDLKCYANCVLEMMQAMKKGKVTADSAIKQIELLIPSDIAEPTVSAFRLCRDAANGIKNPCEAAYALLKCIHANNPKYFFV